ncbi:hypothetical protein BJY59DRAFT_230653 [Rhodotorula toruloides]
MNVFPSRRVRLPASLYSLLLVCTLLPGVGAQNSSVTTIYTTYTDNGCVETWYASTPATPTPTWSSMGGVEAATSCTSAAPAVSSPSRTLMASSNADFSNLEAYSATAAATSDATSRATSSSAPPLPSSAFSRRRRPEQTVFPPAYRQSPLSQRAISNAQQLVQPTQQHPQRHSNLARDSQCDGDDRWRGNVPLFCVAAFRRSFSLCGASNRRPLDDAVLAADEADANGSSSASSLPLVRLTVPRDILPCCFAR